jgi:hypothetical protein
MTITLSEPTFRQEPTEVAPGTFLVHEVQHALGQPMSVFINSVVVDAQEPVLIDCGSARNRRAWLEDTFGLVEPGRVRWVFISHEDADHVGNLPQVMEACPNAALVCSWALVERYANAFTFALERCLWLDDGESFDAGDRTMAVVRPPVYDAPTTRGLFDTKTGVYWASDCFATPVPGGRGTGTGSLARDVAELDPEFWAHGMTMFGVNGLAPWLRLVDRSLFAAEVRRLIDLATSTVVSAHSPPIGKEALPDALEVLKQLPDAECPAPPDQAVLELIRAATQV